MQRVKRLFLQCWQWFFVSHWRVLAKGEFKNYLLAQEEVPAGRVAGLIILTEVKEVMFALEREALKKRIQESVQGLKLKQAVPCLLVIVDMQNLPGFLTLTQILPSLLLNNEFGLKGPSPQLVTQWQTLNRYINYYLTAYVDAEADHAQYAARLKALWSWQAFGDALQETYQQLACEVLQPAQVMLHAIYFSSMADAVVPLSLHTLWLQKQFSVQSDYTLPVAEATESYFVPGLLEAIHSFKKEHTAKNRCVSYFSSRPDRLLKVVMAVCLFMAVFFLTVGLMQAKQTEQQVAPMIRQALADKSDPRLSLLHLQHALQQLRANGRFPRDLFWQGSRLTRVLAKTINTYQAKWQRPYLTERLLAQVKNAGSAIPRDYYPLLLAIELLHGEQQLPAELALPLLNTVTQRLFTTEERQLFLENWQVVTQRENLANLPAYAEASLAVARIPALEKALALLEASAGCVLEPGPAVLWSQPVPVLSCAYQPEFKRQQLANKAKAAAGFILQTHPDLTRWQQFPLNPTEFTELLIRRYNEVYMTAWSQWVSRLTIQPTETLPALLLQIDAIIAPRSALAPLVEGNEKVLEALDVALNQVGVLLHRLQQSDQEGAQFWELYHKGALPLQRLQEVIAESQGALQTWLQQVNDNIVRVIRDKAWQYQNQRWQKQVVAQWLPYQNTLPFNTGGTEVASDTLLQQWYGVDGTIEKFVSEFSEELPTTLQPWFDRMRTLRENPQVILKTIRLSKNIRCLHLETAGTQTDYCHGPSTEINLPLNNQRVLLEIEGFNQALTRAQYSGAWALFQWWQQGTWTALAEANHYEFKQAIGPYQVYFTFVSPVASVPAQIYHDLAIPNTLFTAITGENYVKLSGNDKPRK